MRGIAQQDEVFGFERPRELQRLDQCEPFGVGAGAASYTVQDGGPARRYDSDFHFARVRPAAAVEIDLEARRHPRPIARERAAAT